MQKKTSLTDSPPVSSSTNPAIDEQETRFEFNPADNPTELDLNSVGLSQSTENNTNSDNEGATTDVELTLGSVIKDTYELIAVLGEGGMGKVFKAKNLLWEKRRKRNPYLAIKILNSELSANEAFVDSFFRDFDRTKTLSRCSNIVDVYTFEEDGQYAYITMECLDGKTLTRIIKEKGAISLIQAWSIIEGIGEALDYAHRNDIVHRDIKPANIMMTEMNVIKVLDFGIASKINEIGELTVINGQDLGALTTAYASPEMLRSRPFNPDARDDIYAFACVIYELLTGKKFYNQILKEAESETNTRPGINIPEWIASNGKKIYDQVLRNSMPGLTNRQMEALNKALAFERESRTDSIRTLLNDLKPEARSKDKPWAKILSAASSVVIVIGTGLWWFTQKPTCTLPQVLDPTTKMCVTPPPICTLPQVLDAATNKCVTPELICTLPQVLDSETNTCVTPPPVCTLPQVLDSATNKCVTPQPICMLPQVLNPATQKCVTPPPVCTAPQVLDSATNTCVTPKLIELSHQATSSDGVIQIQTSKPVYKIKDRFRLSLKLSRRKYVRLFIRNAKGEEKLLIDQLFNTRRQSFESTVEGPAGRDTFSIIASETPFPKEIKILNEDGSVSEDIKKGAYSWVQIQYAIQ